MKRSLAFCLVLVMAGLHGPVRADDTMSILRGSAKAFFCTDCHGYNGMGSATAPGIAGDPEEELLEKMKAYKAKPGTLKGRVLARFDDRDLADLAAYFASLKKTADGEASYERDIQPIIVSRCVSCHMAEGEGADKSGLDMRSYEGLMRGTRQGGALIVPGSPETSTFMLMLTRQDHLRMPYGQSPLSHDEIRVIRTWIAQGAKNN